MQVGDVIIITKLPYAGYPFYRKGDRAVVLRQDSTEEWYADFSSNCWFYGDGILRVKRGTEYEIYEPNETVTLTFGGQ
jgi:hypothetical protein